MKVNSSLLAMNYYSIGSDTDWYFKRTKYGTGQWEDYCVMISWSSDTGTTDKLFDPIYAQF